MSDQEASATQQIVNGINVSRFRDTLELLKEKPELGKFQFRAHNKWVGGAHVQNTIHDFYGANQELTHTQKFEMHGDEPDILLGMDHGPNATEVLLAALASCLNATLMYQASARNIQIQALEFEMAGDIDLRGFMGIDPSVRNGFQNIQVKCKVKADASDEQIQELCQLAQKYSPVFDVVSHGTSVNVIPERMQDTGGEASKQSM